MKDCQAVSVPISGNGGRNGPNSFSLMGMEFHVRLRQIAKGLSVRELAEVAGVGKTTAANWLRGTTQPKIDEAVKLAQHFGVTLDELAGLESPTRPVERSPAIEAILDELPERVALQRLLGTAPREAEPLPPHITTVPVLPPGTSSHTVRPSDRSRDRKGRSG
jgi:transcriptional regulator with XRE-family HTH domain